MDLVEATECGICFWSVFKDFRSVLLIQSQCTSPNTCFFLPDSFLIACLRSRYLSPELHLWQVEPSDVILPGSWTWKHNLIYNIRPCCLYIGAQKSDSSSQNAFAFMISNIEIDHNLKCFFIKSSLFYHIIVIYMKKILYFPCCLDFLTPLYVAVTFQSYESLFSP